MNTNMYDNPVTQDNQEILRGYGMEVIEPDTGRLACNTVGKGKMPSEEVLLAHILQEIQYEKDLAGKKVLITAGATREAIDPVRYITNHSTGKMGYAAACRAMLRGAEVTLVSGRTSIEPPPFVNTINVLSALEMYNTVIKYSSSADIIIMAAAVADYRPIKAETDKIKKSEQTITINLERTDDILSAVCKNRKKNQFICGFSMETENLIENSRKKLYKKGCDMIAANNLKIEGAGFGTDTNVLTLITKSFEEELPIMTKEEAADRILDEAVKKTGDNQ